MRALILFLIATATLVSCQKQELQRVDLGHGYAPTGVGHWIEYAVDSSWVDRIADSLDPVHHAQYVTREALVEEFTDPEGRPAQRILRSAKDSNGEWTPKDVWWQVVGSTQVERSEENRRRIKLIFPPRTGEHWNTNALNTDEAFDLTYLEVDKPWSVNGLNFDSTLLVRTTYFNNAIFTRTYYERYAKHVGLVYREVDSTETQHGRLKATWYSQTATNYAR